MTRRDAALLYRHAANDASRQLVLRLWRLHAANQGRKSEQAARKRQNVNELFGFFTGARVRSYT